MDQVKRLGSPLQSPDEVKGVWGRVRRTPAHYEDRLRRAARVECHQVQVAPPIRLSTSLRPPHNTTRRPSAVIA